MVGAIPKITRTGRYLDAKDGTRFFVKGITYQTQAALPSQERKGKKDARVRKKLGLSRRCASFPSLLPLPV
jgi:hypothetical protein